MQEILGKIEAYASMVKGVDPNALVLGPEEWGWTGYFYSGYDQQWSSDNKDYNPADYPDRTTNGGWDYMPWLLNQFASVPDEYRTTPARLFHRCIAIRRKEVCSGTPSTPPPNCCATNRRAVLGHQLRGPQLDQFHHHADSAHENLGRHLLSGHQDWHHRVQLGGRVFMSGAPPRPTSSASLAAKAWTWPHDGNSRLPTADLSGYENVPQL